MAPVEQSEFSDSVEALGTLQANNNVALASTVTELVTDVNFTDGQRVKRGDVLVKMDDAEQQAILAEEKARLIEAQRNVKRLSPLADRGAASQAALEQNQALLAAAQARIKAIETRVRQRKILAPFDGVLGLRNISVGALAQPGTVITTIDDDSLMKLDFGVPEVFLGDLKVGTDIVAKSDAYPDKPYSGTIASIDSRVDPVTRSIIVRAILENADLSLKPGMLMRVELKKNPRQALVVQEESVFAESSSKYVFTVEESESGLVAKKQAVILGKRRQGEAEVVEGLKPNQSVIVHGIQQARDGQKVTILADEMNGETLKQLLKADVVTP